MAETTTSPAVTGTGLRVPLWAWLVLGATLLITVVALQSNGGVLSHTWAMAHEFFHDGRHALGFPCH